MFVFELMLHRSYSKKLHEGLDESTVWSTKKPHREHTDSLDHIYRIACNVATLSVLLFVEQGLRI